jgi:hypothetical protein
MGQLASSLEVGTVLLPLAPGTDDRAQLGVALVEPLGQPRVGVRLGRAEATLELGVLSEQPVDRLEHRYFPSLSSYTKTRRRPRN